MKTKTPLLLVLVIFIGLTGAAHAGISVQIFFTPQKSLTCGTQQPSTGGSATCSSDTNEISVSLDSWGGKGSTLTLNSANTPPIAITGDCVKSWIRNDSSDTKFNITDDCQAGPPPPLPITANGTKLFDEWYADLPWHQKLSTKDSNLIDIPFVLPVKAIKDCHGLDAAHCMLTYGIVNVIAMHRFDQLYSPGDVPSEYDPNCSDGKCVQVKLDIQRVHSTGETTYAADPVTNNTVNGAYGIIFSTGFAITESTVFAPWHPWYMGHFCAFKADHAADAVCYEDYFTTQLVAPTVLVDKQVWLKDRPALYYPQTLDSPWPGAQQFGSFCKASVDKNNPDPCPLYLGKVKFQENNNIGSRVIDCGTNCDAYQTSVNDKTHGLVEQFNEALNAFADNYRYPWNATADANGNPLDDYKTNAFTGYYDLTYSETDGTSHDYKFQAPPYVLPKQCTQQNFAAARLNGNGADAAISSLKECSLSLELHTNGYFDQWANLYGGTLSPDNINQIESVFFGGALHANQYGRTLFMYAGVPEQMLPVSFTAASATAGAPPLVTYDKIFGSSLYTQYLPMVNPDDQTEATKEYQDDFWHSILMSNHMNQTPDHFIRGIRGRTLWHNEHRSNLLYKIAQQPSLTNGTPFGGDTLAHVDFPAGFQPENHTALYHGNTCDACHIRNGSGAPVMPNGSLTQLQVDRGMLAGNYQLFPAPLDYTHTNKRVPAMKLVLFDPKSADTQCDANNHTTTNPYYNNKFMNFYGNSFHVNQTADAKPTYDLSYTDATNGFIVVDPTTRQSADNNLYTPKRPVIKNMDTGTGRCNSKSKSFADKPAGVAPGVWPTNCSEVTGQQLNRAIESGQVGIMHLIGKRLGNSPLIEMIPDAKIQANVVSQQATNKFAGCYGQAAGTRAGNNGAENYRACNAPARNPVTNCYISRWGWIGDRASLEDQIANAAHVEMNITTKEGFNFVHSGQKSPAQQVRYNNTLCGPADLICQNSAPNSDIAEQEIRNMATYQRWIGIPNRSEYQVRSPQVQRGEQQFRNLGCNSCHVIDKISFVQTDNMLPDEERAALQKLKNKQIPDYPYISYLGTDLLLHDMGYLSQVAKAPVGSLCTQNPDGTLTGQCLRNADGTINSNYAGFFQKIRTPALKGLRFNRFVTDSNHNTKDPISKKPFPQKFTPGCDFLLHDGRACDAIEAAFLHDGPAVKQIGMIGKLNALKQNELTDLRAFLNSL